MNFDKFYGIEWESKSHGKPSGKYWLIVLMVTAILAAAAVFAIWASKTLGYWPLIVFFVVLVAVAVFLSIYSKTSRWYNSVMIFAASQQVILFSRKWNASYFSENFDNISGYAYREEGDHLTSVIVYFKNPAPAGTMGKLKEMRMIKIENFDKLKELMENNNIPQKPYPSKVV